jgi:hypothetical protein
MEKAPDGGPEVASELAQHGVHLGFIGAPRLRARLLGKRGPGRKCLGRQVAGWGTTALPWSRDPPLIPHQASWNANRESIGSHSEAYLD